MNMSELQSVLQSCWDLPVEQVSDRSFRLTMPAPFESALKLVTAMFCQDGESVHSIRVGHLVGYLTSPKACIDLLAMNSGGVYNSPYYFALLIDEHEPKLKLTLETTTTIVDLSAEELQGVIAELLMEPLLFRQWSAPQGVVLFK